MKIEVTKDDFIELQNEGAEFLDGIHGGYIIGRSHAEGGVKVLTSDNDAFYTGEYEFEGGEYLVNPWATEKFRNRLEEINQYKGPMIEVKEKDIKCLKKVLSIKHEYSMILIANFPQFIINKYATSKYLSELDDINSYYGE